MTTTTPPIRTSAPWHKASFARFIHDRLPGLLAERLPLAGYRVEPVAGDAYACAVTVTLSGKRGYVELRFARVPLPDEEGVFEVDGVRRVVPPVASSERLDVATVRCVGELLLDHVAERLVSAPRQLPWDLATAEAWVPLEAWVREFLLDQPALDERNWLSRTEHLRTIVVPGAKASFDPGQAGRACPIHSPEGPRVGKVLRVATGATIRGEGIEVVDPRPQASLSVGASMLPFLEHNDPNRSLMAVNMMRQWLTPPDPEPALVRTGHEPAAEQFWNGRNLLTAYMSLGGDTYEDAIVVSRSAAARLGYRRPLEAGDKISNRAGAKGVVSRILPDERMPRLPDGTRVELVYTLSGVPSRMNLSQLKEAVASRIARAEGTAFVAPPFDAPKEAALRERLERAGLPESGMEHLTLDGQRLSRPTTVGWVYWGKLDHMAADKLRVAAPAEEPSSSPPSLPRLEPATSSIEFRHADYVVLRDLGATAILREAAAERSVDTAGQRQGTPMFEELTRRLERAGILAERAGEQLRFRFAPPAAGEALRLARPVRHPWRMDRALDAVGASADEPAYAELEAVNARARRVLATDAPAALRAEVLDRLERAVAAYLNALVTPEQLRFAADTTFAARAVLAPGTDLAPDEVGLPEDAAWALFGPVAARVAGREAVLDRTPAAAAALDAHMASAWVVVHRAPATYSSFVALRPVRRPGRVVRLHPIAEKLLDADHDGDLVGVFVPLTDAARREAAEKLTLAAHFRRDPSLYDALMAYHDAPLGLALLSLTADGRRQIADAAGGEIASSGGAVLTRWDVARHVRRVVELNGWDAGIQAADRLVRLGFDAARRSGASISPFAGRSMNLPSMPEGDSNSIDPNADAWHAFRESALNAFLARSDYDDPDLGPQVLSIKSGSRAAPAQLMAITGAHLVRDAHGCPRVVRHGWSKGLAPDEWLDHAAGARLGLGQVHLDVAQGFQQWVQQGQPKGFHVLARAMRSTYPGIVFAQAAAAGETDPLTDLDARLFVGLPA